MQNPLNDTFSAAASKVLQFKKYYLSLVTTFFFLNFLKISDFCSGHLKMVSIVGATVTVHQFFCILHFCHTCSLCRVELVVQFPARGSTQVLLCLFPGVLWL